MTIINLDMNSQKSSNLDKFSMRAPKI